MATLGIDIGTSKTAAVVVRSGRVVARASCTHNAGTVSAEDGRAEQDPAALIDSAVAAVRELPLEARASVRAVGVTGQMHGVVLVDSHCAALGHLITWQDQRCARDPRFLERLHKLTGHHLFTGYGCATLAWLAARRRIPATAVAASTIHDLAVAAMCGLARPVTDPTDAASWGLFDLRRLAWDTKAAARAGVPLRLLPELRSCGALAGALTEPWAERLGLRPAIPVAVALGDNQASLVATLRKPQAELALTLGTGGQLSAVVGRLPAGNQWRTDARCEYRPYPGRRYLAVAASLCGGAAWAWLCERMVSWSRELGLRTPDSEETYARLNELGLAASGRATVRPHFLGERYDFALRGAIEGVELDGPSLGELARGLAFGIAESFRSRLPSGILARRTRIVGSGNALRRNRLLQLAVQETFGLPLAMTGGVEEAATGAAIVAQGVV
jgi:sedoheptulokinase